MSLRARVEDVIRTRVAAAAPGLAGDLWGRLRLTVVFPRLEVRSHGALTGTAEAWLAAERFDELPVDALIAALRAPIHDASGGLRLRLEEWREETGEMIVSARLIFSMDFLLGD